MAVGLRQNTAEGGTNGSSVTASGSGGLSGDAFTVVGIGTGSSVTFDSSVAARGSLSYKLVGAASQQAALIWTGYTATSLSIRYGLYITATPTSTTFIGLILGNKNNVLSLYVNTAGKLQVQDAASTTVWVSTAALPLNTWLYVRAYAVVGTTTTNGTIKIDYWQKSGSSAIDNYTSATANTIGSGPNTTVGNVQFGRVSGSAWAGTVWLDDLAADDTASDLLALPPSNNPPISSAGSGQSSIEPYTTVTLSGTDSDSDGTIASRQWTQVAGSPTVTLSNANSATATYTAPGTIAGTTLTFGYQVTDNGGAQSTQSTVTHTILSVTERAVIGGVEVPVQTRALQNGSLG